jgi:hypothetical protein
MHPGGAQDAWRGTSTSRHPRTRRSTPVLQVRPGYSRYVLGCRKASLDTPPRTYLLANRPVCSAVSANDQSPRTAEQTGLCTA